MLGSDLSATELLVWALVIHLFVDWLLQNEWMADNKPDLRHPAGYVHAALHGIAMLALFPVAAAASLALVHLVIDSRRPLKWWSRVRSQPATGDGALSIHIWRDQTLHVSTIAAAALLVAG